ncbi:MAG: precorrin-8X methylmutase [Treponema sp.]|jgi:precorrin-8X/cobalt-precorrin-8 methylmutase|nr:precorrin-8X methylmutase [Treponema sp.]
MKNSLSTEYLDPAEIEKRSFEIIKEELNKRRGTQAPRTPLEEAVLMRVIHSTADFDYDHNLVFTHDAAAEGVRLLHTGSRIVTDTQMALAGINKKALAKYGGQAFCFISDDDVAAAARAGKVTRSRTSVDKAASLPEPLIFVVGNAPTALLRIHELVVSGTLEPKLIIGVPVGFVNVEASKELFLDSSVPCIIARGRKGGSNVAAAIVNALLYYGGNSEFKITTDTLI